MIAGSSADARETVRLNGYSAGTIVIKTSERRLYYVTSEGQALRYPVGVGKAGMAWAGTTSIDGKYIQASLEGAQINSQGLYPAASGRSGWQPFKSDGRGGVDPERRRSIRHPRHQQSAIGRRIRLARMLSHVQPRHYGPV